MKTVIRNSYTPKIGDYCETIVVDKETNNAYIFDCDGVFTPVPQPVDVEKILEEAAAYTDEQVAPLAEKLDTIEEGAQVNVIEHVLKNGTELTITNKTVNVTVPTKTSELTNDGSDGTDTYVESAVLDDYYTKSETDTQIGYETTAREIADSGLQEQIDAIVASSDVVDIVGTYAALQAYDTSKLHDNDIIKVLTDETRDDATTYYRWDADTSTWSYIGAEGPFYTKAESDALFTPMTRTINGNALSSDITLTAADVHALPDSTVIPTVNDATLTIQKNGTAVQTFTANQASDVVANITVPTDTSDLTNGAGFITSAALPTKTSDLTNDGSDGTSTYVEADDMPTKTSDFTNDGSDGTSTYVETDELATVATTGDYDDLLNKPTIPTVNDATLTIQKNGTDVATFTANSSTNQTANITVPTDTGDLTNGAGFITTAALSNYYTKSETYTQNEVNSLINSLSIPTKTSDLVNDSGFLTSIPVASANDLGGVKIGTGLSIDADGVVSVTSAGSVAWTDVTGKPTNVSYWTNDAGYITSASIPTNVSSFTNDAGYITSSDIPTNVSAFTNDAGYLTSSALSNYYTKSETYSQGEVNALINTIAIPTKTSDLTNDGDDGVHAFLATDDVATVATTGDYDDLTNKPTIPTVVDMTGATSSTAGAHGYVPAPAAGDQNKVLRGDGTWSTLPSPELVEMSYGESNAWAKFIAAYNANCIVYCRASSNANPATGAQTRKAFMAYVNNETNPTQVEFQYYRSVSSHSDSQQGDQVFVYLLKNDNSWSVTTRNTFTKIAAGTNMTSSYSSGTLTLNGKTIDSALDVSSTNPVQNSVVTAAINGKQDALTAGSNIQINNGTISATDTTYSDFVGTDGVTAGTAGLVPAPATTDAGEYLKADGTWDTPPGVTYTAGTGIDITGTTLSVDTSVIAEVSDLPTKTSDLTNDGSDGTSTYVEADDLATVATSGDYDDLTNKPTIPAAQIQSDWTQADNTKLDYIKNKPTIPTVNNGTLTIKKNGTNVQTFTANQSSNVTADIVTDELKRKGDTRDSMAPNDANYPVTATLFFTTIGALDTQTRTGGYADAFLMNSWNDATGGRVNALVTTKNGDQKLYHYTGTYDGSSWSGKKEVAYTDAIPTKTSDLNNDSGFLTTVAWGDVTGKPTFATVATSGSYNDLSNKPTIPAAQVNSDWNANSGVAQILNKPSLATVATTGDYEDLTNTPSIPEYQAGDHIDITNGTISAIDYVHSENPVSITTPGTTVSGSEITDGSIGFSKVDSTQFLKLQLTTTDPGEGAALAANTLLGVYQ